MRAALLATRRGLAQFSRRSSRPDMRKAELLACFCLPPSATWPEVHVAYRDMVRVWHPDRFGDSPRLQAKANAAMKELNAAFESLRAYFR